MENTGKSYFYALLTVLFWSTVPTAFKLSLREWDVLPVVTVAALTSAIILFLILLLQKKISLLKESAPRDILNSAILGLINPFIYYIILLKAYQLLPAQVAQPLNMIWPIVLVFLSVPILGQKIKKKSYLVLFICFTGVYIISSQGNLFHPGHSEPTGILLALISSVFWALFFILNVRDQRDEAVKLFLNFFFGSLYLVTALIITGRYHLSGYEIKGLLPAIYIGIFEMGISFFFWLKALQYASSTDKVSHLVYFGPFLSLVFVHFFLGEPVYYTTPVGLLLIISGVLIQNRKPVKK